MQIWLDKVMVYRSAKLGQVMFWFQNNVNVEDGDIFLIVCVPVCMLMESPICLKQSFTRNCRNSQSFSSYSYTAIVHIYLCFNNLY